MHTNTNTAEFTQGIFDVLSARMRRYKADGTVAMSLENLWAVCAQELSRLPDAPVGTNAVYYAKRAFRDVVEHYPKFRKFTEI